MIIAFMIFKLTLLVDLVTDVRLYFGRKKVNHVRGAILRILALSPVVYLLGWQSIPMLFFLYMVLFNGLYNRCIGQKWEFLGTTSFLDRIQSKYRILVLVKYIGLITSITFYIWSYLQRGLH